MKQIVYIIDDDPSARTGLTRMIRIAGYTVQDFESAEDFLAHRDTKAGGCILLDAMMPGMTGPELQTKLSESEYTLPIIFVSAHGDVPMTAQAMKKGATDFLTKPVDRDELLSAIESAFKKDLETRATLEGLCEVQSRLKTLTSREYEVLTYVISGLLNKQIAGELKISEGTVKIHRGRVMSKMAVESVAELVRICEHAGIDPARPEW